MINIFKIFGTSSGRGTSSVSGTSSMMGTSSEVGASSGRGTSSGIDVSSVSGTSQELDPSWQERSVINNSTVLAASGMVQDSEEPSSDEMVSGGSALCGGSRFGLEHCFIKELRQRFLLYSLAKF